MSKKCAPELGEFNPGTPDAVNWSTKKRTQKNHQKPPKTAIFGPKFMYFTSFKSMLRVKNVSKSLGNTTLVLPMLYLGSFGNLPPKKHQKPPKTALFGP